MVIWYIYCIFSPVFGVLYQEQSGNPEEETEEKILEIMIEKKSDLKLEGRLTLHDLDGEGKNKSHQKKSFGRNNFTILFAFRGKADDPLIGPLLFLMSGTRIRVDCLFADFRAD
jgi:hypothetical protein